MNRSSWHIQMEDFIKFWIIELRINGKHFYSDIRDHFN